MNEYKEHSLKAGLIQKDYFLATTCRWKSKQTFPRITPIASPYQIGALKMCEVECFPSHERIFSQIGQLESVLSVVCSVSVPWIADQAQALVDTLTS